MKKTKHTKKDIKSIKNWLILSDDSKINQCPFPDSPCSSIGFYKCKLIFLNLILNYSGTCPCNNYSLKFVKSKATQFIKNYEESKLQK